jgi:hypothetical protein
MYEEDIGESNIFFTIACECKNYIFAGTEIVIKFFLESLFTGYFITNFKCVKIFADYILCTR